MIRASNCSFICGFISINSIPNSSTANTSCSLIVVVVLLVVELVVDVSVTGAGNGVASSEVHEVIKTNISKLVSFLFIAYKITTILIY